ncbi:MAG: DUF4783 domain-containing protein [Prevotellaceae bacterium]|jgi:hypothetical protein|nr:DUF4783 domain-containing protein [Prevotellaceae bacterium]
MKTIKITFILLLMSLFAVGQDSVAEQKVFDGVANAVKKGQHSELSAYFAPSIECDILGKEDVYSKAQAIQVMRNFFSKYKAKNFVTLHKSGKGQVKYIIGSYTTTAGENYRMTFFVKQDNDNFLVQQIRIENDTNE